MKIIGCASVMVLLAAVSGCTTTTTSNGGLVNALAASMPNGAVSQNNQTVTTAVQQPNITNVLNAVNTANNAPATPPGTVSNAMTPANINAAVQAAAAANAAKQAALQNANAFGPGPVFGPGGFDTGIGQIGPGAFVVGP